MKRRRSNTLDEADFFNANEDLLAARSTDWPRNVIGSMAMFFGGVLATIDFRWALGAGIGMAVLGAFIQYWPHWKR